MTSPHATTESPRVAIDAGTPLDAVRDAVRAWVVEHVPASWRDAAARGGAAAIREVRSRHEYEEWYPVFGASGLVVPTWPVRLRRARSSSCERAGRRPRAAPVQPRSAQPARPQPVRARAVRVRHRGAAAAVPPAHRAQRRGVVPAVQRARRRIGSRVARDTRAETRRRRVGRHRPEGVDHVGTPCRLRGAARAHRRRRPQAERAHLLPRRSPPAGRRGAPVAAHRRRGRLQRGVPRRRARARHATSR